MKPRSIRLQSSFLAALSLGLVATAQAQTWETVMNPESAWFPSVLPDETLAIPLPQGTTRLNPRFGNAQLHFERNEGQIDNDVKFLARGPGYQIFLTETEAVMVLNSQSPSVGAKRVGLQETSAGQEHVLRMRLVGANLAPSVRGEHELRGKVNYFLGNDPTRWRTNISTFAKVLYDGVYPGADLVYYGNEGRLEYDFVLAPGADPNRIALEFEGADRIELDAQGDLIAWVAGRKVHWQKPVVYQEFEGQRIEIAGAYRLNGDSLTCKTDGSHRIGFQLAAYDRSQPLVIDPVLLYSSYLGGVGWDSPYAIAVDVAGNAHVTGHASSADFPTRSALNSTMSGNGDAFVAKFSPMGELLYSTYLGGSGDNEWGQAVALDASGNCYVAGATSSTNFPLVNPIQAILGGSTDTFITALKPDGSALLFSTFLGGGKDDYPGGGIALDSSGDIYVAGQTFSTDFPILNAFQPAKNGDLASEGFITKLEAGGGNVRYSTYFGGSWGDSIESLAVDLEGNALITGVTYSDDLPIKNAAQPYRNGSLGYPSDFFYAKMYADGSDLFYCSYFGGYGIDLDPAIAVGSNGTFVIAAWTSSDGLSTVTPPASTFPEYADSIVAKFNATDGTPIASTYLGGNNQDYATSVALDQAGDIFVVGTTSSQDFPTNQPLQSRLKGVVDIFLTKLRGDDLSIAFSTYFGGMGDEGGFGAGKIALDRLGNVFITGNTTSTNEFPLMSPFQANLNGGSDAFVAKISMGEVLKVSRSGQTLELSWPVSATNFVLETATSPPAVSWATVTNTPTITATERSVQLPITGTAKFFRLRQP
jgi:hypothetical protein